MQTALLIHGAYGSPEENWFPWLQSELEKQGYKVIVPTFPTPEGQNYDAWLAAVRPHLTEFTSETILIGHSIGATFALCILEQLDIQIKHTVLVSGFLGLLDNEQFDKINYTISDRDFDWEKIKLSSKSFSVLHGDNDPYVPLEKAAELAAHLAVESVIIPGGGHLNSDAGFVEFSSLLNTLV